MDGLLPEAQEKGTDTSQCPNFQKLALKPTEKRRPSTS